MAVSDQVANTAGQYPYPRGQSNGELYQALKGLVDILHRKEEQSETSDDGILNELTTIKGSLDSLEASNQALSGDVTTLQGTLNTIGSEGALTPQQAFELGLITGAKDQQAAAGEIANDAFEWAQQAAEAGLRHLAQSYETDARIGVTQSIRIEPTETVAAQTQILAAYLAGTNATIETVQEAVANGDESVASQVETLQTQANGNAASVATLQSSVDGIKVHYGVLLQTGGRLGFFKLDGSPAEIDAIFGVDKFIIMHPNNENVTAAPFVVGQVNGTNTVGINGALVVDGSILARHIAANSITGDKIAAGSLSELTNNAGIIVNGAFQDDADDPEFIFDIENGIWARTDGTATIDLKNKFWEFST